MHVGHKIGKRRSLKTELMCPLVHVLQNACAQGGIWTTSSSAYASRQTSHSIGVSSVRSDWSCSSTTPPSIFGGWGGDSPGLGWRAIAVSKCGEDPEAELDAAGIKLAIQGEVWEFGKVGSDVPDPMLRSMTRETSSWFVCEDASRFPS